MEQVVILSRIEQEYLFQAIEAALPLRSLRQLFLWAQGHLQALLPHQALVCLQFDRDLHLVRIECLHGIVLAPPLRAVLCDGDHALALRIARAAHGLARLPAMTDPGADPCAGLGSFQAELRQLGFDNVLVHGSGALAGPGSMFALFGMPIRPGPRHAHFLELLLPYLHLALLRLGPDQRQSARGSPHANPRPVRALTARELEILCWVREGKSNYEVGRILGISALTVKNHLQRIYKALGVSNRAHALARCMALRLLDAQRAR